MVSAQELAGLGRTKQSLFCYSSGKKNHEHVLLSFYEFFSALEDKYVGVLSPDFTNIQDLLEQLLAGPDHALETAGLYCRQLIESIHSRTCSKSKGAVSSERSSEKGQPG